jgi:hypothetical protein
VGALLPPCCALTSAGSMAAAMEMNTARRISFALVGDC